MSYIESIKKLKTQLADYGLVLQPPSTEKDIDDLRLRSQKELGVDVPEEYASFLRVTNGLDWNGLLVFAHNTAPNSNDRKKTIQGFVDANLDHRSLEEKKSLLIFAESGDDLYSYDTKTKEYRLIDHITLDQIESFASFDKMISYAIENRL